MILTLIVSLFFAYNLHNFHLWHWKYGSHICVLVPHMFWLPSCSLIFPFSKTMCSNFQTRTFFLDFHHAKEIYTSPMFTAFRPYFLEPEVLMVKREPQDKFMVLATNGFWAHISPDEACSFIQKKLCMSQTDILLANTVDDTGFQTILAKELAKQAITRGSSRNVTVGIILFK